MGGRVDQICDLKLSTEVKEVTSGGRLFQSLIVLGKKEYFL